MATSITYNRINNIDYSISIFQRPELENPVHRLVIPERGFSAFIQRIETNSYPEWHQVKKIDRLWTSINFLGYSKKEAIKALVY